MPQTTYTKATFHMNEYMILQLQNTFKSAVNILAIFLISYTQINLPPPNAEQKRKIKRTLYLYNNKISIQTEIYGGKKNWDDSTTNRIINRKCWGLNPELNIQNVKFAQLESFLFNHIQLVSGGNYFWIPYFNTKLTLFCNSCTLSFCCTMKEKKILLYFKHFIIARD